MINRYKAWSALLLPIKSTAWHYLQILGVAPRVSLYVISSYMRGLLTSVVVLAPLCWRTVGQLSSLLSLCRDLTVSPGEKDSAPIVCFSKLKISSRGEPQL